jgi:hypothetical protein
MKRCHRCGRVQPLEGFGARRASPDGLQSMCRRCYADYYREHREVMIARAGARVQQVLEENRQRLLAHLLANPCVDCGEDDVRVLEFDHREGCDKRADVTRLLASQPWSVVEAEIAKCDVRCASCHRRRTAERAGWWRQAVQEEVERQRAAASAARLSKLCS